MEGTEVTSIFQPEDPLPMPPCPPIMPQSQEHMQPLSPQRSEMNTPLENVMDEGEQNQIDPQQSFYNTPQHQPYWNNPPPAQQHHLPPRSVAGDTNKWDPFSTIGITSWVVIAIVFIVGFIVGKLR